MTYILLSNNIATGYNISYSHHHTARAITSESLWFEQRDLIALRYVSLVTSGLYQELKKTQYYSIITSVHLM